MEKSSMISGCYSKRYATLKSVFIRIVFFPTSHFTISYHFIKTVGNYELHIIFFSEEEGGSGDSLIDFFF